MGKFSKSQSWLSASLMTHLPHGLGSWPILGNIFSYAFEVADPPAQESVRVVSCFYLQHF